MSETREMSLQERLRLETKAREVHLRMMQLPVFEPEKWIENLAAAELDRLEGELKETRDSIVDLVQPREDRIAELEAIVAKLPPPSPTRDIVMFMAVQMEFKLSENRHKGDREGWLGDDPASLLSRVDEEAEELRNQYWNGPRLGGELWLEAADVANMAMMVADCTNPDIFNAAEAATSPKDAG